MSQVTSMKIIDAAIGTGFHGAFQPWSDNLNFQAFGSVSTSTGAAKIEIYGSMDGTVYELIDDIDLTLGTDITSDSLPVTAPWKYIKPKVASISGTDATVSCYVGSKND